MGRFVTRVVSDKNAKMKTKVKKIDNGKAKEKKLKKIIKSNSVVQHIKENVKSNKKVDKVSMKKLKSRKLKKVEKTTDKPENLIPSRKEITKYVEALLKLLENFKEKKKSLFSSEKPPLYLMVNCIKIPKTPLYQMRMILPHSMVTCTDDVALFVKDLAKGRRRDPEDTINHFKDLLEEKGCTQIKTVIPLNQVKTQYRPFEMRSRLLGTYDYFLTDGRISGHLAHLLGKTFRTKRKLPTSVHMDKKNLKAEIDTALRKTCLQIHANGDNSTVQIGSCSMKVEDIVDNIQAVIEQLAKSYPGGWDNIRALRLKTPRSIAIPIYMTLKCKNEVKVPTVTPRRPKAYKEVEGELSTFKSNTHVIVLPDGTVRVKKMPNDSDEESDSNSETEVVDKSATFEQVIEKEVNSTRKEKRKRKDNDSDVESNTDVTDTDDD